MGPTTGSGHGSSMAPTDHHPINILQNNNNNTNTNTHPFDCFTGMGDATGDSDDTALQRWIDNMADEELSWERGGELSAVSFYRSWCVCVLERDGPYMVDT